MPSKTGFTGVDQTLQLLSVPPPLSVLSTGRKGVSVSFLCLVPLSLVGEIIRPRN